jgi:hypothetical protein
VVSRPGAVGPARLAGKRLSLGRGFGTVRGDRSGFGDSDGFGRHLGCGEVDCLSQIEVGRMRGNTVSGLKSECAGVGLGTRVNEVAEATRGVERDAEVTGERRAE